MGCTNFMNFKVLFKCYAVRSMHYVNPAIFVAVPNSHLVCDLMHKGG